MRVCSKCQIEKPENEFYKRADRPCGVRADCKECTKKRLYTGKKNWSEARVLHEKKYQADYNRSNADEINKYSRAYRAKLNSEGPFFTWSSMQSRCNNSYSTSYKYYGARGVKVCEEWCDYNNFKSWALENGWQRGLSIDRINNDGNYEPSNCQWLTLSENTAKRNLERSHY
jgi:hypothetical protein